MLESEIEKTLIIEVKKRGGMALKFISPNLAGVPDRMILMDDGKMAFAELKAPGKKLRPLQIKRKAQLESLGFNVYCIDSKEQIGEILDAIEKR
ncbi:VRR-NUC domain-containing protein [Clostridium beijerinckii]|uniref:VRR-NUC domain-containing protein n=1 Tax=Clostridium beijerinckii TaxID=1520 RepID=UPI00080A4132|nr:VRR-NUC domain-containing protein [Clostridium beijerinckii]OCA97854.1 nuclease [Clostridium beijerinckii]